MDEERSLVRSAVDFPFAGTAGTRFVFGTVLYLVGVVVSAGAVAIAVGSFASLPVAVAVGVVGVLALLPIAGYAAATIRAVLDDESEPPGFGDWGSLIRDGRRVALVTVAYAVPLAGAAGGAALLTDGGPLGPTALGLLATGIVYGLVVAYVLPAALVAVVHAGTPRAALDLGTLREAAVDHRYASAWIVAVLVAVGGGAIGAASAPFVVGFAVLFATHVAATYAVTRGVVVALDLSLEEPPAPPASGYVPGWDDGPRRKELSDGRLGGSLLPTTPGDGEDGDIDREEPTGTAGPLAMSGTGGTGPSDLDRSGKSPTDGGTSSDRGIPSDAGAPTDEGATTADDGDRGAEATDVGSDIAPFVEGDGDIDTRDELDG